MRISDWSSDVCSSDLREPRAGTDDLVVAHLRRKLRQGGRLGNLCLRARGIGFGEQPLPLRAARKRLLQRAARIWVRARRVIDRDGARVAAVTPDDLAPPQPPRLAPILLRRSSTRHPTRNARA